MKRLRHLVRYLQGAQSVAKVETSESQFIDVYVDANFAGCLRTRKSTDIIVVKVHGCVIHT